MNSRERRRQEADQHNYERWLYENTREQRKPKQDRQKKLRRALLPLLAMTSVMNIKILD